MKPRKPWAAGLLSLFVPGLGQLYAGDPVRAALFACGAVACGLVGLAVLVTLRARPFNVLLGCGLLLFALAFPVADAVRAARRARAEKRPVYDHWYVYAAIIAVAVLWLDPALKSAIRRQVEAFQLPTGTMAPTLLAGDRLMVRKLAPAPASSYRRGQLVVFLSPDSMSLVSIKRVVGIPGDTLRMQRKQLFRNGRPVFEPYVQYVDRENDLFVPTMLWQRARVAGDTGGYKPTRDNWGPLVVPPHVLFVLVDNRDDGLDSRYFGFVPERNVIGAPRVVYLSIDPTDRSVRWSRLGLAIH